METFHCGDKTLETNTNLMCSTALVSRTFLCMQSCVFFAGKGKKSEAKTVIYLVEGSYCQMNVQELLK